jgi:hypothetical protein
MIPTEELIKRQIHNRFTYHSPTLDQVAAMQAIREKGKEFAELVHDLLEHQMRYNPDIDQGISKLREAIMWINAGITCNNLDINTEEKPPSIV